MSIGRTILVTAATQAVAQAMSACTGERGIGMFEVPVSENGEYPATWYISSGAIDDELLVGYFPLDTIINGEIVRQSNGDAAACYEALMALNPAFEYSAEDVAQVFSQGVITDDSIGPFETLAAMGLKIITAI